MRSGRERAASQPVAMQRAHPCCSTESSAPSIAPAPGCRLIVGIGGPGQGSQSQVFSWGRLQTYIPRLITKEDFSLGFSMLVAWP